MENSEILERIPQDTKPLIVHWINALRVDVQLRPSRKSKLGDFRVLPQQKRGLITLNNDLGPYHTLLTLTHELAHAAVWQQRTRAKPHGRVWKQTFGHLLHELSKIPSLPTIFKQAITAHAQSPAASTARDGHLLNVLRELDQMSGTALDTLPAGEHFRFRNHLFIKLGTNRTRCKCRRIDNRLIYTIPRQALVEPILTR